MKKRISILLCILLALQLCPFHFTGFAAAGDDMTTIFSEEFNYPDGTDTFDGWAVTLATDTGGQLAENYANTTGGVLYTKMKKSLSNREEHEITVTKTLPSAISDNIRFTADMGLDETGSTYTNSLFAIELLDAAGNKIISMAKASTYTTDLSQKKVWELATNASATNPIYATSEYAYTQDGTMNHVEVDVNADTGKVNVTVDGSKNIYTDITFNPAAIKMVRIRHWQKSYNKGWGSNSKGGIDNFVVMTYPKETPPEPTPTPTPTPDPTSKADPAQDEDEGLIQQTSMMYDTFDYPESTDAVGDWEISKSTETTLTENYVQVKDSVVKTKMQKTLTDREIHTIELTKDFAMAVSGEAVLRTSIGLDETGSKYTNSMASCMVYDQNDEVLLNISLASSYGVTDPTLKRAWSISTNTITQTIYMADTNYPPSFDGTLYDIKVHMYPDKGTMDFYLVDMETPFITDIPYTANNKMLTKCVLSHTQQNYNKPYQTNSAAFFGYIKVDASVVINPTDQDDVNKDCNEFEFSFISDESTDHVTKKLNLKTSTDRGSIIQWISSDPETVDRGGVVTRDTASDIPVTLTAVFTKGYATARKQFSFIVPAIGEIVMKEFWSEDYSGFTQGQSVSSNSAWTMSYPSPKAAGTDVVYDVDPTNPSNTVLRHSNEMSAPQSYAGFNGMYTMPAVFSGAGEINLRLMVAQTSVQSTFYLYNNAGTAVFALQASGTQWVINPTTDKGVGGKITANVWTNVKIEFSTVEGYFRIYFDGVGYGSYGMIENYEKNYNLASFGLYSWNKQSGLNSKLYMDDIEVQENLTIQSEYKRSGFNPSAIKSGKVAADFKLPITYQDASVTWSSTEGSYLSVDAAGNATVIRHPEADKNITLTATFNYKGYISTKSFNVLVIRIYSDAENAQFDMEDLTFARISDELETRVSKDLKLITTGAYGSTIAWGSSDSSVLKMDNNKISVLRGTEDKTAELTATITYGGAVQTAKFDVTVIKAYPNNFVEKGSIKKTSSEIYNYPALYMVDGSFTTQYKSSAFDTKCVTIIDLGSEKTVGAAMLWAQENTASAEIQTSLDNDLFNIAGTISSVNNGQQTIQFTPRSARYIKVTLHPKTAGQGMTVNELMIFETMLTDSECITADMAAIVIPSTATTSIKLPTVGAHGSAITWSSSDSLVISNSGEVTRGDVDKYVTLTAEFNKNNTKVKKVYPPITVPKNSSDGGTGGGGATTVAKPSSSGSAMPGIGMVAPAPEVKPTFGDVAKDAWYYGYVNSLYNSGIINGDENGNFNPNIGIKREEFAKMLTLTLQIRPSEEEVGFADVQKDEWYRGYVAALFHKDIINGVSADSFGVGTFITRQDAAVLVYRAGSFNAEAKSEAFADDSQIADYAKEAVGVLVGNRIITGDGSGNFRPQDRITRAETAKIMSLLQSVLKID